MAINISTKLAGATKPSSIEQDCYESGVQAWRFTEVPSVLIQRADYGARTDGQPEYLGYAYSGTAEGTNGWIIFKYTYDGSDQMTAKNVYGSLDGELANWTARATYTYH